MHLLDSVEIQTDGNSDVSVDRIELLLEVLKDLDNGLSFVLGLLDF